MNKALQRKLFTLITLLLFSGGVWAQNQIEENFQGFPSNSSYTDFTHSGWDITKAISAPGAVASGTGSIGLLQIRSSQNSVVITPSITSAGTLTIHARTSTDTGASLVVEKFVNGDYESAGSIAIATTTAAMFTLAIDDDNASRLRFTVSGSAVIYLHDAILSPATAAATPPSIANIVTSPTGNILSNTTVSVSADITAGDAAIDQVELSWGTTSGILTNTIMMSGVVKSTSYSTISPIPAQPNGTRVYYEVYVEDEDGESATSDEMYYDVMPGLPYMQNFAGFVSPETLPGSWALDHGYESVSAFNTGTTSGLLGVDDVLGFQLTASSPNNNFWAEVSLQNNTGATITDLLVEYTGKVGRTDQTGTPKWDVSVNGVVFPALEYSTADGIDKAVSAVATGLNIADGTVFTVRWSTTSTGTSGTRRRIGITDLNIENFIPPVSNPIFNPAPGTYFADQTVFITNFPDYDAGAVVYYTLNGQDPDNTSLVYDHSQGILIADGSGPVTLKAIAVDPVSDFESLIISGLYNLPYDVNNLAELRDAYRRGEDDLFRVRGEVVLTLQSSTRNQKYIQDATAAILIDDNPGVITTTYNLGDGITGLVGKLATFRQMLQFVPARDPGPGTSDNNVIVPVEKTLADLNSDLQAQLVQVFGVYIDGSGVFTVGQNYPLSDATGATGRVLRTQYGDLDYIGMDVMEGAHIVGVLLQYDDIMQLVPGSIDYFSATEFRSFAPLAGFSVMFGTTEQNVLNQLPSSTDITDELGKTYEAGIENWSFPAGYDPNVPGDYIAEGSLLFPPFIIEEGGLAPPVPDGLIAKNRNGGITVTTTITVENEPISIPLSPITLFVLMGAMLVGAVVLFRRFLI